MYFDGELDGDSEAPLDGVFEFFYAFTPGESLKDLVGSYTLTVTAVWDQ